MVPPPSGEYTIIKKRGEAYLEEARRRKAGSDPRLRAAELRRVEREFAREGKETRERVSREKSIFSAVRERIASDYGSKTPQMLFSEGRAAGVAGKMLANLAMLEKGLGLLSSVPRIVELRMRDARPGILSELKTQQASAISKIQDYKSYWQFVQSNPRLPGFFNFGLKKYNTLQIIAVINGIFAQEDALAIRLFEGLDYIFATMPR